MRMALLAIKKIYWLAILCQITLFYMAFKWT